LTRFPTRVIAPPLNPGLRAPDPRIDNPPWEHCAPDARSGAQRPGLSGGAITRVGNRVKREFRNYSSRAGGVAGSDGRGALTRWRGLRGLNISTTSPPSALPGVSRVTISPADGSASTPRARRPASISSPSATLSTSRTSPTSAAIRAGCSPGRSEPCSSATGGTRSRFRKNVQGRKSTSADEQTIQQAVAELLGKLGARNVGVEAGHLTLATWRRCAKRPRVCRGLPRRRSSRDCGRSRTRARSPRSAKRWDTPRRRTPCSGRCFTPEDTEKGLADAMDGYLRRAGRWGRASPRSSRGRQLRQAARPAHRAPRRRVAVPAPGLGRERRFYKSDLTRTVWHGHTASVVRQPDVTGATRLKTG